MIMILKWIRLLINIKQISNLLYLHVFAEIQIKLWSRYAT